MRQKDNLYSIVHMEQTADGYDFQLQLNNQCFIYAAHFPGMPVTPGICLLQMAREMLEEAVGRKMKLTEVKNAKFLSVVSPSEDGRLMGLLRKISIDDKGEVKVQVTMQTESEVKTKLSIQCQLA